MNIVDGSVRLIYLSTQYYEPNKKILISTLSVISFLIYIFTIFIFKYI